ncbi:MAG: hypothetical protein Q8P22_02520, partial [Chloroflexota bacterium]|nr:hypothetical protein [Chloroflexota bacterium]
PAGPAGPAGTCTCATGNLVPGYNVAVVGASTYQGRGTFNGGINFSQGAFTKSSLGGSAKVGIESSGVSVYNASGNIQATSLAVSGSKSAVVETSQGNRLLYTEESSEVWFTDYGFGQLKNGRAVIQMEPLFAETVNLDQPYHVFVQAYGDADLYVSQRTPTSFEVVVREGDPNAEFSYRLVAKRLGFEDARLEVAP